MKGLTHHYFVLGQVEQKRALQQTEHLGDYNIWYGRYMGENNYERAPKASTRVCIETDAGLTRADYTSATAHLCLHWLRCTSAPWLTVDGGRCNKQQLAKVAFVNYNLMRA